MKTNVVIGILRAWLALGIIIVPVVSIYIDNKGSRYGDDAGKFFFIGFIVVIGGFFLLRWIFNAFSDGILELSIKSVLTGKENKKG